MSKPETDKERTKRVIQDMLDEIASHDTHEKKQVGPCVYCVTCGNKRLYQGKLQ